MPLVRRIAAALVLLGGTAPAAAATELFDGCAAASATRWELGYESTGIAGPRDFYAYHAIDACKPALEEDPANVQIMAWLGHAYVADNQVPLAVPLLQAAAGAGNAVALRALGDLLILGKGVAQDKVRGVELLRQAAAQDFVPAFLSLGYSFEYGDGVPADAAQAMEFYTRAGEAGLVRAQLILADHFRRGIGVAADDTAAFGWLARAAGTADPEANYELGVAYLEGRGTGVSIDAALAAFQVSAADYFPRGRTALGYMTELGLGGLAADPDAARSLYYTGESARIPAALHNLARLTEIDDPIRARERYERAAMAGEVRAAVNLARMMLEGSGGPQDVAGALDWTRKAADSGNAAGINNLGRMYELGLGVAADAAEARRLYGEAAALGYQLAAENLARLGG